MKPLLNKNLVQRFYDFCDEDQKSIEEAMKLMNELLQILVFLTTEAELDAEFGRILDERMVKFKLQKE